MTKIEIFNQINVSTKNTLTSSLITDVLFSDMLDEDKLFEMYVILRQNLFREDQSLLFAESFLTLLDEPVPPVDPEV